MKFSYLLGVMVFVIPYVSLAQTSESHVQPIAITEKQELSNWPRLPLSPGYFTVQQRVHDSQVRSWSFQGVNSSAKPEIRIYAQRFGSNAAFRDRGIAEWLKTAPIFKKHGLNSMIARSRVQILLYTADQLSKAKLKTIGISVSPARITLEIPADLSPAEAKKNFDRIEEVVEAIALFDPEDPARKEQYQKMLESFGVGNCSDFGSEDCKKIIAALTSMEGGTLKIDANQTCPGEEQLLQLHTASSVPITLYLMYKDPNWKEPQQKQKNTVSLGKITVGPLKGMDLCDGTDDLKVSDFIAKGWDRIMVSMGGDFEKAPPVEKNAGLIQICKSHRAKIRAEIQKNETEIRKMLMSAPPSTQKLISQLIETPQASQAFVKKTCKEDYTVLAELLRFRQDMNTLEPTLSEGCDLIEEKPEALKRAQPMMRTMADSQSQKLVWFVQGNDVKEERRLPNSEQICKKGPDFDSCINQRDAVSAYLELKEREILKKALSNKMSGCFLAEPSFQSDTLDIRVKPVQAANAADCMNALGR